MIGSKGTLANYLHCVLPKICLPYTCRPIRVEISASSTPECAIKSKSAEYDGARIILYLPQESNDNQKVFFARVACLPIIDAYSLKLNQPRIYPFMILPFSKMKIERAISEGTSISSDRNVREL